MSSIIKTLSGLFWFILLIESYRLAPLDMTPLDHNISDSVRRWTEIGVLQSLGHELHQIVYFLYIKILEKLVNSC